MILKVIEDIKAAVAEYSYNKDSVVVRVGDIYDVNNMPSVKYPCVVVSQGKHNFDSRNDYLYYNLTLFYIDNMVDMEDIDYSIDVGDHNWSVSPDDTNNLLETSILSIQSAGTKCLLSALYALEDKYVLDGSVEVVPFKEKFNDVCAGVYVNIKVREELTHCELEM